MRDDQILKKILILYILLSEISNIPMHILSVAIRDFGDMDDHQLATLLGSFCKQHREELFSRRVRRITFAALKKYNFISINILNSI